MPYNLKIYFKTINNGNRWKLTQEVTKRSMEQDREARNRHIHAIFHKSAKNNPTEKEKSFF